MDKSQSATNKESKKARINTSSIFQWNTSILHSTKDIRMAHENKFQEKAKLRNVIYGVNAPKMTHTHFIVTDFLLFISRRFSSLESMPFLTENYSLQKSRIFSVNFHLDLSLLP